MLQKNTEIYLAHTVKTDADVGATFHLEPNHNPRSGEPATTWFALTRAGGETIALEACNCQLTVFRQGDRTQPVATPTLEAISAEGYENIPGAEVIFPEAGVYELQLTGTPQEAGDFQAFSLSYEVTVRPGTTTTPTSEMPDTAAATQTTAEVAQAEPLPETPSSGGGFGVGGYLAVAVGVLLVVGGAIARLKSR